MEIPIEQRCDVEPPKPPISWLRLLGNVEGLIALLCVILVVTKQTTVADRFDIPWYLVITWAVGIGSGLGAIRYGTIWGRLAGWLSVIILAQLLATLIIMAIVKTWM